MESNARAELTEVDRLAAEARRASQETPTAAIIFLMVVELGFVTFFAATKWSLPWPIIGGWLAFLIVFFAELRRRRKAKPVLPWATPESRRRALVGAALTLAANAVFIPLWMFSRWLAVGALMAVLAFALVRNFSDLRRSRAA